MFYTLLEKTQVKYSEHDALSAAVTIAKERSMERTRPTPGVSKEKTLTLEQLNQQSDTHLRNCFRSSWSTR
jgi:hypothetical protein